MNDIETRIKGMQCDYESLKKLLSKHNDELKRIDDKIEFLMTNISIISETFNLPLKYKTICIRCKGYGRIYISPISDMGQGNECMECKTKGYIWAPKKHDIDEIWL